MFIADIQQVLLLQVIENNKLNGINKNIKSEEESFILKSKVFKMNVNFATMEIIVIAKLKRKDN